MVKKLVQRVRKVKIDEHGENRLKKGRKWWKGENWWQWWKCSENGEKWKNIKGENGKKKTSNF